MADFEIPFASDGERRFATVNETSNGFPCGPADQQLFNGLFYQLHAELNEIHQAGGISGSNASFDTTLQAIQALIAAATGSGDTSQFVLFAQARARLPFYPEISSSDNKINVTSPAGGVVRIPGGVSFIHRGIYIITTAETDFPTEASKIYHIRWSPDNGYEMFAISDPAYNPTVALENDALFDSTYDDMLIARVTTNSSNVATITNLANKHDLRLSVSIDGQDGYKVGTNGANFLFNTTFNWSRRPTQKNFTVIGMSYNSGSNDDNDLIVAEASEATPTVLGLDADVNFEINRYVFDKRIMYDYSQSYTIQLNLSA